MSGTRRRGANATFCGSFLLWGLLATCWLLSCSRVRNLFVVCPSESDLAHEAIFPTRLSISPDGKRALYDLEGQVYEIDLASRIKRLLKGLTVSPGQAATYPSYGSDGKAVIYTLSEKRPTFSCPGNLYIYSLPELSNRRLTEGKFRDYGATVSPDGKRAVFARQQRLSAGTFGPFVASPRQWVDSGLYFIDLKSGHVEPVAGLRFNSLNGSTSWSKDGTTIIFAAGPPDAGTGLATYGIYSLEQPPESAYRLTPMTIFYGQSRSLSCDGFASDPIVLKEMSIAFSTATANCSDPKGSHGIFLTDIASGATRELYNGDLLPILLAPSPDGNKIYFVSVAGDWNSKTTRYDLWYVGANDGQPHHVTELGSIVLDEKKKKGDIPN